MITQNVRFVRYILSVFFIGILIDLILNPGQICCGTGQHLPPFGVLLSRGVKTLAHLKAGNQSVTS
jgi:hypothetical protein